MEHIVEILVLAGTLLAIVALIQVASARLGVPEATLLSIVGIALGASYVAIDAAAPDFAHFFFTPLVDPRVPAEAYLWLFLPPLLFQVALTVDVRNMLQDAAPILLLAIVAVFVATAVIGIGLAAVAPQSLVVCLLLGAIVATTDPSAVVGIFRDVGAPSRLIRLVEGESLLNDAAAIALAGVLIALLTHEGEAADWLQGLRTLGVSFGGGVLVGAIAGRLLAAFLPLMGNNAPAETALTMALPYPLYLLCSEVLDVSGVVAVVCAALVVNALARTRLAPRNWQHVLLVWNQIAVLAGAIVFLLAALRVPHLLAGVTWRDGIYLLVTVAAAFLARLAVLFLMLPVLSRLGLSEPISAAYRLAIAWGGLRGAVTLVLAMGVAENEALSEPVRHFVSIMATGFVLFSLVVNGGSLSWVMRRLKLDRLSPQEQALQQQAIALSTEEVEATVRRIAAAFRMPDSTAEDVNRAYHAELAPGEVDLRGELTERERLDIGLITLATRERDLIPEYGNGVVSVRNLDAMMRNTGQMIDATRIEGRLGYKQAAQRVLQPHASYRAAVRLHRWLGLERPLAAAVADRFELLICRRAELDRQRVYNRGRQQPLLGERMAGVLDGVLEARAATAEEALAELRGHYGDYTRVLERRMLMLFALRKGRAAMEAMVAERVISKEVYGWVRQEFDRGWRLALERPPLHPRGHARSPGAG